MGRPQPHTPPIEWIVAAISTLLVLLLFGYVVVDGISGPGGTPSLQVRADSVVETPGGYVVVFTVRNDGGETAAAVIVQGARLRGDSTLEESEAVLDYVPTAGSQVGGLIFTSDPRRDSLELRVAGFQIP